MTRKVILTRNVRRPNIMSFRHCRALLFIKIVDRKVSKRGERKVKRNCLISFLLCESICIQSVRDSSIVYSIERKRELSGFLNNSFHTFANSILISTKAVLRKFCCQPFARLYIIKFYETSFCCCPTS